MAAILSIETCRRISVPVREYLAAVPPGLGDVRIQKLAEFTVAGLGNPQLSEAYVPDPGHG